MKELYLEIYEFSIFRDFSRIFMNFSRFILNFFEFKTLKKDFYALTDMANDVTCRLMCCHMTTMCVLRCACVARVISG